MKISDAFKTAVMISTVAFLSPRADSQGRGRGLPECPHPLKITVPAFSDGGSIPSTYGCAAGKNANLSPNIRWTGAPEGTASFALILHDPDLMIGADDVLHWAIFNIPGTATELPQNVPAEAALPDGSVQLQNHWPFNRLFQTPVRRLPPSITTLFELYALDQKLDPAPASRADLMKAMAGHVNAKGSLFWDISPIELTRHMAAS